ncbi:hypothetical protein CSPX01_10546 [Colletotrichum filicis]|nr:hypothetical protein CSPX01_10546 [Colletotrichum filicis]
MVVPCCPLSQCIGRCPSRRASKEAFEFTSLPSLLYNYRRRGRCSSKQHLISLNIVGRVHYPDCHERLHLE